VRTEKASKQRKERELMKTQTVSFRGKTGEKSGCGAVITWKSWKEHWVTARTRRRGAECVGMSASVKWIKPIIINNENYCIFTYILLDNFIFKSILTYINFSFFYQFFFLLLFLLIVFNFYLLLFQKFSLPLA